MIDHETEQLIAIKDAPRVIPGRPHLSTVYRWTMRSRHPLEVLKVGGKTMTSIEAISRFIGWCNTPDIPTPRPSARRQRQIERAERELSEAGV